MRNLIRRLVAGLVLVVAVFVAVPASFTFADDGAAVTTLAAVKLSAVLVTFLIGTLIPILVGIITRTAWPPVVKAIANIVATAANALIVDHQLGDGSAFITQQAAVLWLMTLAISIAVYLGVYVPANLTNREGGKLAGLGLK